MTGTFVTSVAAMYTYSVVVIVTIVTGTAWGCGDCIVPYKPTSCQAVAERCFLAQSGVYTLADGDLCLL